MGRSDRLDPGPHVRRKRLGLARRHVDIEAHDLEAGAQRSALGVIHAVEEVQALVVVVEKLGRDTERIALFHLGHVVHMQLQREERAAGALAIGLSELEMLGKRAEELAALLEQVKPELRARQES